VQQQIKNDWLGVVERLETILQKLLQGNLIINITADASDRRVISKPIKNFIKKFPKEEKKETHSWQMSSPNPEGEALLIPSRVNYVGRAVNLFDNGYQTDGSAFVITKYLRTAWLWEQIRVQGGAYGAICNFDPYCGIMAFASYRDPNLSYTLGAFAKTGKFLKEIRLDDNELTRALIGAIGGIDTYLLPDAKGYTDMMRYLTGQTDEKRQKRRDEILATTEKQFREFGEYLSMKDSFISVLGSPEAVEESGILFKTQIKVL
jgi:Zn-dependent M16 (insulinase) family peptidase